MKTILFLVLLCTFAACSSGHHDVKLPNGSIVKAFDNDSRDFKAGDTVCLKQVDVGNWYIDNQGRMQDTSYIFNYRGSDGQSHPAVVIQKIGVIK
jgi:hypothetical protein